MKLFLFYFPLLQRLDENIPCLFVGTKSDLSVVKQVTFEATIKTFSELLFQ